MFNYMLIYVGFSETCIEDHTVVIWNFEKVLQK